MSEKGSYGRRSDPAKLRKERERIVRDLEQRQDVPQAERTFPNLMESIRRVFVRAAERRRAFRNPPPEERGAKVIGTRRPPDTA